LAVGCRTRDKSRLSGAIRHDGNVRVGFHKGMLVKKLEGSTTFGAGWLAGTVSGAKQRWYRFLRRAPMAL